MPTPPARRATLPLGTLYALLYGMQFLFITYLPIYYGELHFTSWQIGVLTAVGFAVTIGAQGLWGVLSDRSRSKNRVLVLLVAGTALVSLGLFFPKFHSFAFFLLLLSALYFFMKPILSMTEAMALEAQEMGLTDYGRVRAVGSFAYAGVGLALAALPGLPVTAVFGAFTASVALAFLPLRFFPVLPGRQHHGPRTPVWPLLRNRRLLPVLVYGFFLYWLLNYRLTFFPVYFTNTLGYPKALITFYTAAMMLVQVPVLAMARRWLGRVNLYPVLLLAGVLMLAGYVASLSTTNQFLLVLVNLFHSLASVLLSYCGAVFVNANVPPEQASTGQGLWAAVTGGLGPVVGSLVGGVIGSALGGVRQGFVFCLILSALVVVVFAFVFHGKCLRLEHD